MTNEHAKLEQPTDADVADAVETLFLKEYQRPEGYASWNHKAFVRLNRHPCEVLTSTEARAWAVLLLREADEAEAAVEEKYDDGTPDERDDETQKVKP